MPQVKGAFDHPFLKLAFDAEMGIVHMLLPWAVLDPQALAGPRHASSNHPDDSLRVLFENPHTIRQVSRRFLLEFQPDVRTLQGCNRRLIRAMRSAPHQLQPSGVPVNADIREIDRREPQRESRRIRT
jgi:hypothetical protein